MVEASPSGNAERNLRVNTCLYRGGAGGPGNREHLSSTYCVPIFIKHLLCARPSIKYWVCIKSGDPHTIHVKWALLISIFQRRKLRSREVPKDTEQETEVLRVGFWKEGATQSPELKGKRGNVGGNGLRV